MAYYNILTAIIGLLMGIGILLLIRRDYLHPVYSLWWLFIAICALSFGIYPQLSDILASRMGIGYPPILIIVVALVLIFIKSLIMDIERTNNKRMVRKLVQEVSILKEEVEWLRQQMNQKKEK